MSRKPFDRSNDGPDDDSRERDDGSIGSSNRGKNQSDEFSVRRAKDRYGDDYTHDELRRIHRLEQNYGSHIKDWADEGMPVHAMTDQEAREAFRLQKGTPIPEDIYMFNKKSENRNKNYLSRIRREEPDGDTQVPDVVREAVSGHSQSLNASIQRAMEERMGDSFGDVQIHADARAAEAAEAINARAFTVGNHIVFNHGEYDPSSAEGQHVLAHELAHVRQQTDGALSMLPQEDVALEIDPDPELEREAEETARRVMSGGELDIHRMQDTEIHVQRLPEDKLFDAMAIFEAENSEGTVSEFRQTQNTRRLGFLHDTAADVLAKEDKQEELRTKRELKQSDSRAARETAKRGPSEADVASEIDRLTENITDDLSDVGMTDDQRATLTGDVVTDEWDSVPWTTTKAILSVTSLTSGLTGAVSAGLAAGETAAEAAGHEPDRPLEQATARIRKGEISSWDDVKAIWQRTNGSLKERAERIQQEIRSDEFELPEIEGVSESRK